MNYDELIKWAKEQPDSRLKDEDLLGVYKYLDVVGRGENILVERLLIELLRERAGK